MTDADNKNSSDKKLVPGRKIVVGDLPEILDKVPYLYANHARLSSNKWDIRVAFGEIGPTGQLEPRSGVILPHITAKGLAAALARVVKAVEERVGEIVDPDQTKPQPRKGKAKTTKKGPNQPQ